MQPPDFARKPDPAAPAVPRGIRNHNPGNIRHVPGTEWQGQARQQTDPAFVTFEAPVWGLRAILRILLSYRRQGIVTVDRIIARWAPPVGQDERGRAYRQDSEAYAAAVARALDVLPSDPVDVTQPETARRLLAAIVRHENGQQPYPRALLEEAVTLAGISGGATPEKDA